MHTTECLSLVSPPIVSAADEDILRVKANEPAFTSVQDRSGAVTAPTATLHPDRSSP